MDITFEKYEGCGNDFIVVELDAPPSADRVRKWCDRHFGVGADGVLVVSAPSTRDARARFVVVNADGSRPEMCGNGLRCVAIHLARRDGASVAEYSIETDAGPLLCRVERRGDKGDVEVAMGRGRVGEPLVHRFENAELRFERVSMGNPHAIQFDADLDPAVVDRIGPEVCASVAGGTNVEFVAKRGSNRFDLVVWERGVGRTLACGTGAAATAVALALSKRAEFGVPIEIDLPGGPLEVSVEPETLAVTVRGPARRVFSGALSQDFAASK